MDVAADAELSSLAFTVDGVAVTQEETLTITALEDAEVVVADVA